MLNGEILMTLAREALGGIPEEESKYAPLTAEMKAARAKYEKMMADAPEGAVIDLPYSQSETLSDEQYEPFLKLERELIAEHRAREAIKDAKPEKNEPPK
jgi:hypothetical protein